MKCRDFELDLPEWVRGRLTSDRAQHMAGHESQCAACARTAQYERDLVRDAPMMPAPAMRKDLWPDLMYRLADSPAARPGRRHALSLIRWAVAGAVAASLGFVAVRTAIHPHQIALAKPEDEARVVKMIAAMEPVTYMETDAESLDIYRGHEAQRALLIGDPER